MAHSEQPFQIHQFLVELDIGYGFEADDVFGYEFEAYDMFVPPPEQTEGLGPSDLHAPIWDCMWPDWPNPEEECPYRKSSLPGAASDQIDVIRVARAKENKQARDKHVLGLLTTLRAVFPGNVTENIGRQILPYAKYDPVPDVLQLKLPTKAKRKVQGDRVPIKYDKKGKPTRKHQAPFQRR